MNYEAVTLINRTGKVVEWRVGGAPWVMENGEIRSFNNQEERFAAHHALKMTNTGLEEYTPEIEEEEAKKASKTMPDYSKMKWQKLVSRMGEGFKPGMDKEEVVKILESKWKEKNKKE